MDQGYLHNPRGRNSHAAISGVELICLLNQTLLSGLSSVPGDYWLVMVMICVMIGGEQEYPQKCKSALVPAGYFLMASTVSNRSLYKGPAAFPLGDPIFRG